MRHRTIRARLVVCALATLMLFVGSGDATPHKATWISVSNFEYHVLQMPDIDQWWWNLPGEGSMYCAPAAGTNLILYAANHGFPSVPPGPGCWNCPLSGNEINTLTNVLADMGTEMGTSADGGTGTQGILDGLTIYLSGGHKLDVYADFATPSSAPLMEDMAHSAVAGGSIVMFCFGRYVIEGQSGFVVEVSKRNTGHCVTMVRAERSGEERLLWSRDPAQHESPRDLFNQSLFTNRVYDPVETYQVIRLNPFFNRNMTALEHPVGDGRIRLIDKAYRLRPSSGYSFTPNYVQVHIPNGSFVANPNPIPVPLPIDPLKPGFQIVDSAEHPKDSSMILLTQSSAIGEVRRLDGGSGETTLLGTFSNPTALAVGRRGDIFVIAGNHLFRREVRRFDDPDAAWTSIPLMDPAGAPVFPNAIAYDDIRDETVLISSAQRVLLRIGWSFLGEMTEMSMVDIPTAIPLGDSVHLAVDFRDHLAWFTSDATSLLYGIALPIPGVPVEWSTFGHAAIPQPRSISIAPDGRLYVTVPDVDDEVIVAFAPDDRDRWLLDTNSPFHGLAAGAGFRIAYGRTNYDPEFHDGPDWLNIHPDEEPLVVDGKHVPDCYADLNADLVVNVADLLILISQWGQSGSIADLNHDGTVNVSDLLIMIGAWGQCPNQ